MIKINNKYELINEWTNKNWYLKFVLYFMNNLYKNTIPF